jgi:glucose/arabinose dehydrogenase
VRTDVAMRTCLTLWGLILGASSTLAQDRALSAVELKTVLIDSVAKESFLCVRADTMGRLFVGGDEALYVYEPNKDGGYWPRALLYRFPPDSRLCDVAVRGNDLYVLTRSALYLIPDGVRQRDHLQPRKVIWGVPLGSGEQNFHALAWGPEGDLYIAMGDVLENAGEVHRADPWGHWTFFSQPRGVKTSYNGVGAVLRCKPDGSALQVVARGLRNPHGLVFDRYWSLFTSDVDQDSAGLLVYVTPHAYFRWPGAAKSPIAPPRADLLPAMSAARDKAIYLGATYYDETLLPEKSRHNLLLARGETFAIVQALIEPRGAGFAASEQVIYQGKEPVRSANLTVGRGGRIFVAVSYQTEAGVRSELLMVTTAVDPALCPFEPYEAAEASAAKLWRELADPSWQRRYCAHVELTRRGGALLKEANKKLLTAQAGDHALHHLIWLAAKSGQGSLHLFALLEHADPRIRAQVIRALTEFPEQSFDEPVLTNCLHDKNPHVRHAAVLAHFSPKIAWTRPIERAIEDGLACSEDSYLRQSATLLLADKATRKELENLCAAADARKRLAGVLAAGFRLTLPPATKLLARHLPLAEPKNDSACIIAYADGRLDLRQIGRIGRYTVAEHWKADMHTADQELLFTLLRRMLNDTDGPTRVQAARFLALLNDSRSEKEVEGVLKTRKEN